MQLQLQDQENFSIDIDLSDTQFNDLYVKDIKSMIDAVGLKYVFDNLSETRINPLVQSFVIPAINYFIEDTKTYFSYLINGRWNDS